VHGQVELLVLEILRPTAPRKSDHPAAVGAALHDIAPSRRQRLLRYHGDRGVSLQHVGVLVGTTAHRLIWPVILRWIKAGPAASVKTESPRGPAGSG